MASRLPDDLRHDPDVAALLAEGRAGQAKVLFLSYRAGRDEAGPGKGFDFSRATIRDRWEMGAAEMREALRTLEVEASESEALSVRDIPSSTHAL